MIEAGVPILSTYSVAVWPGCVDVFAVKVSTIPGVSTVSIGLSVQVKSTLPTLFAATQYLPAPL